MKSGKILILTGLILVLLVSTSWAVRYPALNYPHAPRSAASVHGSESVFFNPGSLRSTPGLNMMYYHSFNDSTFDGDNGLVFAKRGLGISYYKLHLDRDPSVSSWTIAFGSGFSRELLVGGSYTFYKTDRQGYHNDHFWKLGLTYRPNRNLSIAAVADNLNRMEFDGVETSMKYTIAAAIRAADDRLTLAADYDFYQDEEFNEGSLRGLAEVKLKEGVWLNGHLDEEGAFGFGLTFAFGTSLAGAYVNYDDDQEFLNGVLYTGYSDHPRGYAAFEPRKHITLRLSGNYSEEKQRSFLWREGRMSFSELILGIEKISEDNNVNGLVLYIDHPRMGFAQLEELREKLLEFRSKGKTIAAYLSPLSGTGSYYIASAADKIAMQRVDALALTGLLAEVTYYKGTLDMLGIEAQIERVGNYKSLADLMTADSLSPYHEEAINAMLDDLWGEVASAITKSRRLDRSQLDELTDRSPMSSAEALEAGLVDTLLYPDEFQRWATGMMQNTSDESFHTYCRRQEYDNRWGNRDKVAIIPVEGSIVYGGSYNSLFTGKALGSSTLNRSIRTARNDKSVKAVVLRVNSTGGEVFGSESIWRELRITRESKPVIISMGNTAASGAYHLSIASDHIFSRRTTLTGSIGVIYGKANLADLREKIGFSTFHIKRGKNADIYRSSRGYSYEQRTKIKQQVELVYEDFVSKVAESRQMTYDDVDAIGQGRTWTGIRALDHGLVDEIGGVSEAIDAACTAAGINRADAIIQVYTSRSGFDLPSLEPLRLADAISGIFKSSEFDDLPDDLAHLIDDGFYFRAPYELQIR